MKRLLLVLSLFISIQAVAQQEGYKFTDEIRLPATSVKDQYRSGTCWSFSTISFIESEMIRLGTADTSIDLSEMYIVRNCYSDKAEAYVRWHGTINFGGGGEPHDVMCAIKKYGLVPETAYPGLNYGTKKHNHGELDRVLKAYVDAVVKGKTLTTAWHNGFDGILDAYFGKLPKTFTYKGKEYTPQSFAKASKINPDNYVAITSFSNHPFFTRFILEMPDNWKMKEFWNVPLDDMLRVIDNALENGYTVAWSADVSEPYFSYRNGVAVVPAMLFATNEGTEWARWEKLPRKERYQLDKPGKEMKITQEIRQKAWDNWETTDDHGMHIIGRAHDQNGTTYYIVKNSWNTDNPYKGYLYVSKAYVAYKTISIMVHKDALPKDLKKKLDL